MHILSFFDRISFNEKRVVCCIMKNEDLKKVYNSIRDCFQNQDYYGVLRNFEQYLSFKNSGLTETLMSYYAISLEQLGFYEEALKAYQIKKSFYNNMDVQMKIIHLLHRLSDVEQGKKEVESLLLIEPNNSYYHYLFAKFYFLNGEIMEAKEHFNKALLGENNKSHVLKAQKYLLRIEQHEKENTFLKVGYNVFLKNGHVLEPGYIIDVKNKIQYVNKTEENGDTKSAKRPYLIWKVEENKVYAFQITGKVNYRFDYVISPTKYPNLSTEVTCKDNVCVIDKNNISSIIEKIDPHDLINLLSYTYAEIMHSSITEQEKRSDFLEEMQAYFQKTRQKSLKNYK